MEYEKGGGYGEFRTEKYVEEEQFDDYGGGVDCAESVEPRYLSGRLRFEDA